MDGLSRKVIGIGCLIYAGVFVVCMIITGLTT